MKIGENSKSEQINNQLSVSEQQSSSKMKIKNTSHQTISLGNTAFASIREANSFYIDKTDFIRQWWESQDDVRCGCCNVTEASFYVLTQLLRKKGSDFS